jgi:hypothetical protein
MLEQDYFSDSYSTARQRFRQAVQAGGGRLGAYRNPATCPGAALGHDGLTTDVGTFGSVEARRVLVAQSATHGVEGLAGSGIQAGWLASGMAGELPKDTALLLVHALNPHGFAALSRVNEDNIDLNRNFVDHGRPYPANPGYEELRDAICPRIWTPEALKAAEARLDAYAGVHGAEALQGAISSGQYVDPEGVFHGGHAPCWSNRTLHEILRRHAGHASAVAIIDLHTGLGPSGYGEIMNGHDAGSEGFARVREWFGGEATSNAEGSSSSAPVTGDTLAGAQRALPLAKVTGITLEYGTRPLAEVLRAIRADNWLRIHGEPDSDFGRSIKSDIRGAFYPDTDEWKRSVFVRSVEVYRRMLAGLCRD